MIKLEQKSADGWQGYVNIYGLESKAALEAYFDDAARKRFATETAPFESSMRIERVWGAVACAADGDAA